jgi:predicted permease
MHALLNDLRHALRALRRGASLSFVIIASLAIGIGTNTAIFSVANALMLKPLPYPDPDRLAVLWLRSPGLNIPQDWPSPGQYIDIRTDSRSFDELSISQGRDGTLLGLDQPERVEVLRTSSNLFRLLGATPLYGRLLLGDDDVPGRPPVAILGHDLWRRLFNADPKVVGRSITLNGVAPRSESNQFTIAGVLAPDFSLNDQVMPTVASIRRMELFIPLPLGAEAANARNDENYNLMGRLKPGVTFEQAQADVSVIAARIRDKDKRDRTFTISVVPLIDQVVGNVRRTVFVLLGSVALVLLIACANVANLLLTRATGREKEIAVSIALGANWQRLLRQLLTESVLLGLFGGAAGLVVAYGMLDAVRAVNPGNIPRLEAIDIDLTVLVFTFALSIGTGILFGLAPAWRAMRLDLNTALKSGGRGAQREGGFNRSRRQLRSLLVVSEVAIALVLLVGAGLLIRSFVRLQAVSPGFNPANVLTLRLGASGRRFANPEAATEFNREFAAAVATVPGVTRSGAVTALPFTSAVGWGLMNVEGFLPQPGQELQVDQRAATAEYFRTMEIPLVRGRFFTDFDSMPDAQPVAIVDDKFADRFWPGQDPLGKRVWTNPKRQLAIVGVVGSVKQYGLDVEGRIVVYYPAAGPLPYLVARTSADPTAAVQAIVKQVHAVDPTVPVYDVRSMQDRVSDSLARQRFSMLLLGAFAMSALLLAAVGVYGVLAYLVTQGTRDIGVHMALGAQRSRIMRMVIRHGLELTFAGIFLGLAGAAALTRVMTSLLFGVGTLDLATFTGVSALLASIALLACCVPVSRALRVDPVVALREE